MRLLGVSILAFSFLQTFAIPQRCDKGSKVCQKLEADDPVFQGQRCEVPSDCKDPYNPYCSKWGYCISYDAFGDQGPGQSKGAVEDGTRGQCRDDNDCTPWAPTCSPLGYCRGGVQDGSFGSPTNPKAGGEQSDWVKQNAKSGGGRNKEYYGKIEDDNRQAHVKFRKENPIFYEQIPVLLPRLEQIEKNVYEPCTYCKYDPKSDGDYQKLVERLGNNQNGRNGSNSNKRGNNTSRNGSNNGRNGSNKSQQRRPQNGRNGSNKSQQRRPQNGAKSGSQCPGGSLNACKAACPTISKRVTDACTAGCTKRCS